MSMSDYLAPSLERNSAGTGTTDMGMDIDSNHVNETEAEVEMDSLPVHPHQLCPHLHGSMNSKVSGMHMCHLPCLQYSHSCRRCVGTIVIDQNTGADA